MQLSAGTRIAFAEVNDMERNRKDNRDGGILSAVAELFDLPADVVAGLPHMGEMVGSRQLYLEHHTGLLSAPYSERSDRRQHHSGGPAGAGRAARRCWR